MTDQAAEDYRIMRAGFLAANWLAQHAAQDPPCGKCAAYRRRVAATGHPAAELHRRCGPAREKHEVWVEAMKLARRVEDGFECDAADASRRPTPCSGDVDTALVERRRRDGAVISYVVGCAEHVRFAEARMVARGSTDRFEIVPLDKVATGDAHKLRRMSPR